MTDAKALAERIVGELMLDATSLEVAEPGVCVLWRREEVVALIARHLKVWTTQREAHLVEVAVSEARRLMEEHVAIINETPCPWATARAIVQTWIDAYPEDVWPDPQPPGDMYSTEGKAALNAGRTQAAAYMARHMGRELLKQFDAARREGT